MAIQQKSVSQLIQQFQVVKKEEVTKKKVYYNENEVPNVIKIIVDGKVKRMCSKFQGSVVEKNTVKFPIEMTNVKKKKADEEAKMLEEKKRMEDAIKLMKETKLKIKFDEELKLMKEMKQSDNDIEALKQLMSDEKTETDKDIEELKNMIEVVKKNADDEVEMVIKRMEEETNQTHEEIKALEETMKSEKKKSDDAL